MDAAWTSVVAVAAVLVLLAVVAVDRNRLRRRLDATDGAVTGLRLDLQAAHERIEQLQSYLNRSQSWQVDAAAPADVADREVPDRWSPGTPPAAAPVSAPRVDTPPAGQRDPSTPA